ncbi:MAG TPA: serine/threonine protein kinase [Cyanothece sp. UBA12306]|nr:serine/threonine protein kinase [Cyanothece sp. UBA12306]
MITLLSNRYQILETLGKGGFGETFLAVDTQMPSARKCVIKLLKPSVQSSEIPEWLKERFKREAAVLEKLGANHPQIPGLYAYFSENNNFYLVQEWIEGETLTQIHQRRGNFSENEVREILINILPILDYIHSHRIIHRDLKPDNIIIRHSDGQPVLIDFGIVKEAVATQINSHGKTAYSVALGTPGYMPSEQAAGRPVYSSDIYSLGLTAVFLLTGKTPQYLETDLQTGEILWRKEIPHLHSHLANIIDRTVYFHPKERFPTAKKMLAALETAPPSTTAPTLVILSNDSFLKTPQKTSKSSSDEETETPWFLLSLGSFLVASAIFGALTLGFMMAVKQRSRPLQSPSPEEVIESPEPKTFPGLTSPEPETEKPVRRPRRPIQHRSKPKPPISPTPESEVSPNKESETDSIAEPTKVTPIPVEPPPNSNSAPIEGNKKPDSAPTEDKTKTNPSNQKSNSIPTAPDIIINTETQPSSSKIQVNPSGIPKSNQSPSKPNSIPTAPDIIINTETRPN